MSLKSGHVIQLVEAGALDKDDLIRKVVDLIDHHVLDLHDDEHLDQVGGGGGGGCSCR